MRGKITWIALCTAAMLIAEIYVAKTVQATAPTPPPGFMGTTMARGTFSPFQVFKACA
ncbi:MAG TPA: hypothetical protein VNX88_03435 [Terriglobales bacterium]|jgi:hypothetical protein|nr:hypothetical protein [Terriglobales bacterium]